MLLAALALLLALPAPSATTYEADWTSLLERILTDDGLVRYDLLSGPLQSEFDAVVEQVEAFDATGLDTDEEKLAFWMNAYNVKLVERVLAEGMPANLENYGFDAFFKTPVRVAQQDLTLDQVEHVILRRQDGPEALEALAVDALDPRIHVGLNCGALSCPRLRPQAFTPENVDAELDRAMRDFVNDSKHLHVQDDETTLSSLLDWFGEDFGATGEPAGDYLLGFMSEDRPGYARLKGLLEGRSASEIKEQPRVQYAYFWDLNAAP